MSKKSLMPKMGEIAPTLIFGVKIQTFTWIKNKIFFHAKNIFFGYFYNLEKRTFIPHTKLLTTTLVIHFDNSLKIVQEMPRQVKKPPALPRRTDRDR